jgi:large subunit ribosomal protein L22
MAAKATARWIRIGPRKARMAVDLIRGKSVGEALAQLSFARTHGARAVKKVLESAVANARKAGDVDVDTLFVATAMVNQGPTVRRFLPRAMGRATRINKKTAHITLELREEE